MAPWWLRSSDDEDLPAGHAEREVEALEMAGDDDDSEEQEQEIQARDEARDDEPANRDGPAEVASDESQSRAKDDEERPAEVGEGKSRRRRRRRRRPPARSGERKANERKGDERQADERKSDERKSDSRAGSGQPPARAEPPAESVAAASEAASWEAPARSAYYASPDGAAMSDERKIAMFCDLENVVLGVRASEVKELDVNLILARLLEKGKIIVKKAYADWERYSDYKRPFHEAAVELIDIPQKFYSGKNSADIKMVVDAMDLCYSKEHLDTFAIISGDSDFSPLVSKLKENNKYVIGIGVRNSSSSLLIDNCDEFIFYEDVWRVAHRGPRLDHLPAKDAEVFGLMCDSILALVRENKEIVWGSMVKQTMQRKRPSFNESAYGYGSFSELLEDAKRKRVIRLQRDENSGNYVVTGFAQRP